MKLSTEKIDKTYTFVVSRQSVIPDGHFLSLSLAFALCVKVFVVQGYITLSLYV